MEICCGGGERHGEWEEEEREKSPVSRAVMIPPRLNDDTAGKARREEGGELGGIDRAQF